MNVLSLALVFIALLAAGCDEKEAVLTPPRRQAPAPPPPAPGPSAAELAAKAEAEKAAYEERRQLAEAARRVAEMREKEAKRQAEVAAAREEMTGKLIGDYTYKHQLFEEVRVREVTDEGFKVMHKTGSATFLFESMPRDIQERYGYAAAPAERPAEPGEPLDQGQGPGQGPVRDRDRDRKPVAGAVSAPHFQALDAAKEAARKAEGQAVIKSELATLNDSMTQLRLQKELASEGVLMNDNMLDRQVKKYSTEYWNRMALERIRVHHRISEVQSRISYLKSQLEPVTPRGRDGKSPR